MLITRQFYQWLIEMQQRPSDYGMPSEHHKDVQAIFSAFLGRSNENVHIWRTVLDKMTATERQADSVTVHIGLISNRSKSLTGHPHWGICSV
jgi:hypothetical protein